MCEQCLDPAVHRCLECGKPFIYATYSPMRHGPQCLAHTVLLETHWCGHWADEIKFQSQLSEIYFDQLLKLGVLRHSDTQTGASCDQCVSPSYANVVALWKGRYLCTICIAQDIIAGAERG